VQIQINTDNTIGGREPMAAETTEAVAHALRHLSDHITRVEVHIEDENGPKGGQNDIRCMLEARLKNREPIAVTDHADSVQSAVHGAAKKLAALIEHTLGRADALRRAERT